MSKRAHETKAISEPQNPQIPAELKDLRSRLERLEQAVEQLQAGLSALSELLQAQPALVPAAVDLGPLRRNAKQWKENREDCQKKTKACTDAVVWVREKGKFTPAGSNKGFEQAMSLSGDNTLASAFKLAKLLGVLAQESSFGTKEDKEGPLRGPFQLSEGAVKDYNAHNDPDVKWPDDVDGLDDLTTAAKVAAWYLAYLLQQLTFSQPPGATTDPVEANKLALAAYNAGIGRLREAQKKAKDAGQDPHKWADIKEHLPKETQDYVDKVRGYEQIAYELGCVL